MSQSRFSIVLVGVSALLRRPLVSRLRPADGERSPWVVFAARGCRFDSGFRSAVGLRVHRFRFSACTASELPSAGWSSGSLLPLFGMQRFGDCPRRVGSSAFRFGVAAGRVGLRAHRFRFSARTASEIALGGLVLPFGGLAFGFTASAFRHAPIRRLPSAGWFFRLPLRKLPSAGWPSGSPLPLFGTHCFGVAAGRVRSSAFRFGVAVRRVGLRVHRFRFSARAASEWPRRVSLRAHRFRFSACTASELPLGELAFGLLLRKLPSAG